MKNAVRIIDPKLHEMIFKRKSFHLFRDLEDVRITQEEKEAIIRLWNELIPLHDDIRTAIRIVPAVETSCKRGEDCCILIYSERKDGWLENVGYLGEQLDLALVARDIGTLWFGIGKVEEASFEGMEFVIMIAIHKVVNPAQFRKNVYKIKRKPVGEIWEGEAIEGVTDIVRFAPSACNTQPWLAVNDSCLSIYRFKLEGKRGIMPKDRVSFYNCIDIGIYLCFLELCLNHEGYSFERKLFPDDGEDRERTLNAEYVLMKK